MRACFSCFFKRSQCVHAKAGSGPVHSNPLHFLLPYDLLWEPFPNFLSRPEESVWYSSYDPRRSFVMKLVMGDTDTFFPHRLAHVTKLHRPIRLIKLIVRRLRRLDVTLTTGFSSSTMNIDYWLPTSTMNMAPRNSCR